MKKINYTFLLAEFFILYLGALTGWILARKIVGDKSGFQFLMLALFVSSILFAGKILIYSKAKKSLFYNLIFIGGIAIDLAWLFNCLILPLFWLSNFGLFQKICVLAFYTHICVGNILLALKTFDEKWENAGRRKVEEIFELDQNPVDWGEVSRSMRLEAVLFIPGIPLKYGSAISVILVLMAFLGLVLRGGTHC